MRNRPQIPIRCAALIDAPVGSVRRALGRSQVWSRTARAVGGRLEVAGDPVELTPGSLVRFRPGRGTTVLLRAGDDSGLPVLRSALPGRLTVEIRALTSQTGAGTLATVEFDLGSKVPLLTDLFRPMLIGYGEMLLGITTLVAREPVRVVAGAVIAEGKVLLARRRSTPAPSPSGQSSSGQPSSGQWELPGGKVEPGESDRQALQRELLEELAVHTTVVGRIGPVIEVEPGVVLVCYQAEMAADEPILLSDHDEYRWVGPDALDAFDLLAADRQLVDLLIRTLQMGL